jgi:biopolymer transport protein ExbD
VLLIIFMVTARLIASQGLPLVLPEAVNSAPVQDAFSIILAEDGSTQIDGVRVANDDSVLASSRASLARNPDLRAIIKADGAVPHRRVIHMLDLLRQGGVSKIAFGVAPVSSSTPVRGAAPRAPAAPGASE